MKVLLLEKKISVVELPLKEALKNMDACEFIKSLPVYGQEEDLFDLGTIK